MKGLYLMGMPPKSQMDVSAVIQFLRRKTIVVRSEASLAMAYGLLADYARRSDVRQILLAKIHQSSGGVSLSSLAAARSLAWIKDRQALTVLRQALKSPNRDDRLEAIIAIGNFGPKVASAELKGLENDPNPTVRRLVRNSMGKFP
jgi:HEAT repeat protein